MTNYLDKMKATLLSFNVIFLIISSTAIAQDKIFQNSSFAILGGINLMDLKDKQLEGGSINQNLSFGYNGYHTGVNVQIPVITKIFLQPGLLISQKMTRDQMISSTLDYRISYIEFPLNFVYKTTSGSGYFMFGLGPYISYGVSGKAIYEDNSNTTKSKIEFKNDINANDPPDVYYMRPFDAGGNLFLGHELAEGFFIQLNIEIGVVNIHPEDNRFPDDNSNIKNSGFGISAGYRFY
jgi:hypothetical protein